MKQIRCPVCGKLFDPTATEAMPFCSRRCRMIDLGRWLGEEYTIPVAEQDDEEDETQPPEFPTEE
jgi:hypothetical protein